MPAGPFILEIDEDKDGPCLHAITPSSVLIVNDAEDLQQKLDAYENPVKNGVVQNTPKARRWYVEKILPALRFYCDKYGVHQPDWLIGNNHWETMQDDEKERLFGPGELRFREFKYVNQPDIQVIREPAEGEEQQ